MSLAARLGQHIEFGQAAMTALGLDHEKMTGRLMGEGPTHGFAAILGNQHDAVLFRAAMLQLAPVVGGETGIAPAVGLEGGLVILKSGDEGQDRRFVAGQMCVADANGRMP